MAIHLTLFVDSKSQFLVHVIHFNECVTDWLKPIKKKKEADRGGIIKQTVKKPTNQNMALVSN